MRTGINLNVSPSDRLRLDAVVADRNGAGEWIMAKAQFAVIFGERFEKVMRPDC
jgi:hypothetical protein